jgi:hypothetical protein
MQDLLGRLNIKFFNLEYRTPFVNGFDPNEKISEFLNIGELYNATKVLDKSTLMNTGLPIDVRLLEVHTLLRKTLNQPITIGSAYRSYAWELKQGRSGTSQHVQGHAMDFSGNGLDEMIESSINEKDQLYDKLRKLGVNGFGLYSWGVHLDFRPLKSDGNISFWDERKKKTKYILGWILSFFIAVFLSKQIKFPKSRKKSKLF